MNQFAIGSLVGVTGLFFPCRSASGDLAQICTVQKARATYL